MTAVCRILLAALLSIVLPSVALAQRTPGVKWKTPASWNIEVLAGRTFSSLTILNGDPARAGRRESDWVAGATFGRYDGRRIGFNLQLLFGKQRTTELLFDPPRPAAYALDFVEVPLLMRFDPLHRKDSGGLVSVFGGVGIGRRFHLERTFDAQTSPARWAMYTDAIAGASLDLRRVIVNVEYLNGLTNFTPASGPAGAKHLRSLLVTAGYAVKRGPMLRTAEGGWEMELHAGGLMVARASAGDGTLPPAGASFQTVATGISSRRVSTWLVGDGAALFNQATGSLPPPPTSIVPLDRILTESTAQRKNGAMLGVRLAHPLTSRVSAELALDLSDTPPTLDRATLDQIDASRASFAAGFSGLLSFLSGPTSAGTVTATTEVHSQQGKQVLATTGLLVRVMRQRRVTPFAHGGLGVSIARNGTRAIVRGVYDFQSPLGLPFHESDSVTMKFSSGSGIVGFAGAGVTCAITERSGLRLAAGLTAGPNRLTTTLSTTPAKNTSSVPLAALVITASNPSIQFTNFNSSTTPSSLSGTPLQDFETFRGRGVQMQTAITIGFYRRF